MAVIGSGSSAIQIVPGIQPIAKHIDHYVRGKTWIAPTFAAEKVKERGEGLDNCRLCHLLPFPKHIPNILPVAFTEEDVRTFKESPETYQKFRKGKS
jgi:hypothetical protein